MIGIGALGIGVNEGPLTPGPASPPPLPNNYIQDEDGAGITDESGDNIHTSL